MLKEELETPVSEQCSELWTSLNIKTNESESKENFFHEWMKNTHISQIRAFSLSIN